MKRSGDYLPTLDGWRAIAIVAVILYHDSSYVLGPFSTRWMGVYALHGVDIFFAISGLLICSRLIAEEELNGRIDIRGFYIRRALRILPSAYFYLLVLVVLRFALAIPLMPKELLASALFYRNYSRFSSTPGHIDLYTSHFWTLAVEEHFYLILPGILLLAPKRWRIPLLGGMVAAICGWRLYRQQMQPWQYLMEHTDTRLDALLVPAMVAILLASPGSKVIMKRLTRYWPVAAAALFGVVVLGTFERAAPLAEAFLIPFMLLGTVLWPAGWFGRFLELAPIRWVGKISYSLYLWQELFFTGHFLPGFEPFGILQSFPFRWLVLFVIASLSYYFLEKPLIRLGHRLAPPVTSGMRSGSVSP